MLKFCGNIKIIAMNKLFHILALLLLTGVVAEAQSYSQYINAAEEALNGKDYYSAMKYFEKALEIQPKKMDVRYQYADAARLIGAYEVAESAYETVRQTNSVKNFPLLDFWLAEIKQKLGNYERARQLYAIFRETNLGNEDVPTYYIQRAEKEEKDAIWAANQVEEADRVDVKHLGREVNSEYSEFGSFIQGDTLYYTSFKFAKEDQKKESDRLYNKLLISVNGEEGELWTEVNESGRHTAHTAFNAAGNRLYYTICEYKNKTGAEITCEIYYRNRNDDGNWSAPIRLPDYINMEGFTTTHPAVGWDQNTDTEYLFFSSDRPGGKGESDIWWSPINEEGAVGPPENLEVINTRYNDITPFFHNPSQTLYFSSEGHQGLGAYDLFKSEKRKDDWGVIENLGHPINSSFNDIYFSLNEEGDLGYFSSNRYGSFFLEKENKICCNDLYAAEFDLSVEFLALTLDAETGKDLLGSTVEIFELTEDGREVPIDKKTNALDNTFPFRVLRDKEYVIRALRNDYMPLETTVKIDKQAPEHITEELRLAPITVTLEALTFDLDTELPLSGATVTVTEISENGEERVMENTNEFGNDFTFDLNRNKNYRVKADKPGYEPMEDEVEFDTYGINEPETFNAELYLKRTSFGDYLPLAIYFDNDLPGRNSRATSTSRDYSETVEPYYERKEEYLDIYTTPMAQEERFLTVQRYEAFFERELKKGFEDLNAFAEALLKFLEQSPENTVELKLRGFASPRAESDYNYNLSLRRISSVENYFQNYEGGIFRRYMSSGQLIIGQEPFGEFEAPNFVSDILENERESIYSLSASLERRVELIEVETKRGGTGNPESSVDNSKGALRK